MNEERELPVSELFLDDGIEYLAKRPDEILSEVRLPATSSVESCRSSFWKLRRRGSIDFAVLSVAAAVWFDDAERVKDVSIYLGAVGSHPLFVSELDDLVVGKSLSEEVIERVANRARRVATPMDNTDFKTQWRGVMVERYTTAALREIAGLEPGLMAPNHSM